MYSKYLRRALFQFMIMHINERVTLQIIHAKVNLDLLSRLKRRQTYAHEVVSYR